MQDSLLENIGISFYERETDHIYLETSISSFSSFLVLKDKVSCNVAVPKLSGNSVAFIKTKKTNKNKISYSVPIVIDNINSVITVLSAQQYHHRLQENLPINLVPVIDEKKTNVSLYFRSKKFVDDNRYELINHNED